MRKTILFTLLVLLGLAQAVAQEYEYVPFVREGVQWVYAYYNPFWEDVLDMPEGLQYYSFEMKGDVQIGDKWYKPVVLTHYLDREGVNKEVEAYTPICLREEDKRVYAIHPDGIQHPQCPVAGWSSFIDQPDNGLPITTTTEEFLLYDFNDPTVLYTMENGYYGIEYKETDMMVIAGQNRKCHHYRLYNNDVVIIEGLGYDGYLGYPLLYFEFQLTGLQVGYGLSHVIENSLIAYKGVWYNPDIHVGIDEVVADRTQRPLDANYYNLTGRAVGIEVPTTPGIYIHQGKKIAIR